MGSAQPAPGWVGSARLQPDAPGHPGGRPSVRSRDVEVGRAVIAALLAAIVLRCRGERLIMPALVPRLAIVVAGVVIGFPLLTAFALQDVNSAHAAVVSGLLPAATAGMAAVLIFAVSGAGRPRLGDLLVLGAVAMAGLGYAEGGALARQYGGWRVICWALILALPILAPVTAAAVVLHRPQHVSLGALAGLGYVTVFSMFLGFFVWYEGLARGGVARVGRLQLAQPVLTLAWSALLLGEHITLATAIAAVIVLASVAVGRKARVERADPVPAAVPKPQKNSEARP